MSDNYVTKGVKFNVKNPHQRELLEWCVQQSPNFSGFVRDILFAYKLSRKGLEVINEKADAGAND